MVLLHALAQTRELHGKELIAVHVDHGLHADSANWASHCQQFADGLGIQLIVERVSVDTDAGLGPEAAARESRYAALLAHVGTPDWLLSAHHEDDHAETLLLNLLRGSGPLGIAGIPAKRAFGDGLLVRPLLDVPRHALESYAAAEGLTWIEDPSNEASDFDRNFLRHEVLDVIRRRWPDANSRLARSASLARDAAGLLVQLADIDLAGSSPNRIQLDSLRNLPAARSRNLLRRAASLANLPPAASVHLDQILEELVTARDDAEPRVAWPGAEVRRYRDHLYLMAVVPEATFEGHSIGLGDTVDLGPGLGQLRLAEGGRGLNASLLGAGLRLQLRKGGEEIKPAGQQHTRKLKKLLQEHAVVPWLRDQLPLVYAGERLVAVGDLWVAADVLSSNGIGVEWLERPPLN